MKKTSVRDLAKVLKAVANQRRLMILKLLWKEGPQNVGQIARKIDLSYKSTSKHLQKLEGSELVTHRQTQTTIFYLLPEPDGESYHAPLLRMLLDLLKKS